MKFAYVDPPYLGLAEKFYGALHPEAAEYDDPEAHRRLIARLVAEYPDGWVMHLHMMSLRVILPMVPAEARLLSWVKPFASWKPGVGLAYAWEPVVLMGGRQRTTKDRTTRDWCAANMAMRRGLRGAKPARVVSWLCDALNVRLGDQVDDLFPGSGAVREALNVRLGKPNPVAGGFFDREAA